MIICYSTATINLNVAREESEQTGRWQVQHLCDVAEEQDKTHEQDVQDSELAGQGHSQSGLLR